jgi:hypothetical protein
MENIVDYTSAEEDSFLGRNQAYSLIEQSAALCLELMKGNYLLSSVILTCAGIV